MTVAALLDGAHDDPYVSTHAMRWSPVPLCWCGRPAHNALGPPPSCRPIHDYGWPILARLRVTGGH